MLSTSSPASSASTTVRTSSPAVVVLDGTTQVECERCGPIGTARNQHGALIMRGRHASKHRLPSQRRRSQRTNVPGELPPGLQLAVRTTTLRLGVEVALRRIGMWQANRALDPAPSAEAVLEEIRLELERTITVP